MILTITLNPSIDRRYNVNEFQIGQVFRTDNYQYTVGGKGLNVTKVIKSFDEDVVATGFLGGSAGAYIDKGLNSMNIQHEFIGIEGETRSCLAIISNDGSQTEILERGPTITNDEYREFFIKYEKLLDRVEVICASGSLPYGLPLGIYKDIIKMSKDKGKKFLLDTSGEALRLGIESAPYLVKPNKEELEALTGVSINNESELMEAAKYILDKGVEIVVVSLGEKGAMVFNKDHVYRVNIPTIKTVSPVGSGDSMIAGFAVSLLRDYDFETMLKIGAACGTANALESETGKVNQILVNKIIKEITIDKLKI